MTPSERTQRLMDTLALCRSGYAGVDANGQIKDRRTTQGLIAMRKNQSLHTPEPLPVEGEFKEGSAKWHLARNSVPKIIKCHACENERLGIKVNHHLHTCGK